eukprot:s9610_g1.t1
MTPLALSLGLGAPCASEAGRIPPRMTVEAVKQADGTLPQDAVYVGQGHRTHRIPKTKWAAPMVAGHDCPFHEFLPRLPRYLQHVRDNLLDQIHELFGKTLVVDSITAFPSEGDALASLVFEALSEQAREPRAGRTREFAKRMANRPGSSFPKALGLALTPMVDASQVFSVYLRQEDVFAAVRKLFPEHWLSGLTFPFIEDLVNGPPFDSYTRWLKEVGADWAGPCGPALAHQAVRVLQRADGQQAGALNQRAALPPLLSFGLSVDEHFEQATARLRSPMPTEQAPAPALRRVTAARDIGLIALLVVLFAWPDTALPFALIAGMPAVGFAPCYGVFPQIPVEQISFQEVMGDWRARNARTLERLGPSKDDEFLLQQSTKDFESGFCSPPLTKDALLKQLKGRPYRLIPRCVITLFGQTENHRQRRRWRPIRNFS